MKQKMQKADYAMFYFHIEDLLTTKEKFNTREEYESYYKQPGTLTNRCLRYFKGNVGKGSALKKLLKLIESEEFVNVEEASKGIDWGKVPVVKL